METKNIEHMNASPIINGEEVTFIYRGEAKAVYLVGDHNRWELEEKMTRLNPTDAWQITKMFSRSARLDYKYVVDGNWIADPLNHHTTQVGAGVNSTLIMPGYKSDYEQIISQTEAKGTVLMDQKLSSRYMGKEMTYHVYLPPDFEKGKVKHILYALDGSDYVNYAKINLVLDYLISHKQIPEMVAILIDPDDRNRDYTLYEPHFRYVTEDLMPFVEDEYMNEDIERSIIGVSWGGLTAFFYGFSKALHFSKNTHTVRLVLAAGLEDLQRYQ